MKKIILGAILLLLLCGCSKASSVTPQEVSEEYKKDFSVSAKAAFDNSESEMKISKNGMSISISVESPAELSGMGIEIFDEHAEVSYNGAKQEIKKESLPEGTAFLLLEELFDELSDPEGFSLSTDGERIIAENGDFSAVISSEDFSLISAEFPFYETEFVFSEFEFSAAE